MDRDHRCRNRSEVISDCDWNRGDEWSGIDGRMTTNERWATLDEHERSPTVWCENTSLEIDGSLRRETREKNMNNVWSMKTEPASPKTSEPNEKATKWSNEWRDESDRWNYCCIAHLSLTMLFGRENRPSTSLDCSDTTNTTERSVWRSYVWYEEISSVHRQCSSTNTVWESHEYVHR